MEFKIPHPLKAEHDELHNELERATMAGGKVGDAANAVAQALHAHFEKEEEYALPPLGLLPVLASGEAMSEMREVLRLTDKLKAELPHMLQEHKAIVAALTKLIDVAKEEKKPEVERFAEKLMLHAQTEEEVLYPAAILIGRYVRMILNES